MIPWQVSLRYCAHGNCHYCGGTILDSKTILTAAHCEPVAGEEYVMAGAKNVKKGKNIKIAQVITNPDAPFNDTTLDNDIVILKLEKAIKFNKNRQPACLPSDDFEPEVGSTCFVSGWGSLKEGANKLPKKLQYVGVPMISNQACNDAYADYGGITDNMICAGFEEGGKDSCQGDSGGPFICMENGTPVITGVVSWGVGCARAEYPGVYAKVTNYLPWIKANLEQ